MPPKSKAQQKAAGVALAAKKSGKTPPGKGPAASMAKSMDQKQLKEFASAPQETSKLPNKMGPPSASSMRMKPRSSGRMVNE